MAFQDDNIYVERVKMGDQSAFASLVEKHKDMVYTIVVRIVKKSEDAEEIAQDVFLKVYDKLEGFRGDSKFSTWLYRIAYNAAISKTRKRRLEVEALDEFTISNYSDDEVIEELERIEAEKRQKLLNEALEKLTDDDYLIIKMFYLKEMSVKDISVVNGLSQANIKVKLHRIRKKIYGYMKNSIEKNNIKENIIDLEI